MTQKLNNLLDSIQSLVQERNTQSQSDVGQNVKYHGAVTDSDNKNVVDNSLSNTIKRVLQGKQQPAKDTAIVQSKVQPPSISAYTANKSPLWDDDSVAAWSEKDDIDLTRIMKKLLIPHINAWMNQNMQEIVQREVRKELNKSKRDK